MFEKCHSSAANVPHGGGKQDWIFKEKYAIMIWSQTGKGFNPP
jgi:hypothetical protein